MQSFRTILCATLALTSLGAEQFPLRTGFESAGGAVIGNLNGKQFSITHLIKGKTHRFILTSDNPGFRDFANSSKDLAKLDVELNNSDYYFVFGEGMCRVKGSFDPEILALVHLSKSRFQPAVKAWRANRLLGNFEPISPKGIDCLNEGHGA